MQKERHEEFLRGKNQRAEELGVALPGDLSQTSVNDDQLLEAIPKAVEETVFDAGNSVEVEHNTEENLDGNEPGMEPDIEIENRVEVEVVDENLTSNDEVNNVEEEESESGSSSGDSDDESHASEENNSVTGVIHKISNV